MKGPPFFQGEIIQLQNHENILTNSKFFLSRTFRQISTMLSTKHPWVMFIQMIEGPGLFPRGDNYEIAKIKKKSSSIEPLGHFQKNLAKNIPGWRGFKFVQMEKSTLFLQREINGEIRFKNLCLNYWANFIIYILVNRTLLKCIHWFELVSEVSSVAHGRLFGVILHKWYIVWITKFSLELFGILYSFF